MDKQQVCEHDKQVMLRLAKLGVESHIIAEAFGIPKMAVAAYRAWETMRAQSPKQLQ